MANYRIMLVDNEEDFVAVSALLLKQFGHQVSCYYDGPSALADIETIRPDAILLDIGMPPIDGYKVCRRLRAKPWGQAVAVIALTGFGREIDKLHAYEAGFDTHLLKPASIDQLTEVLTRCITSRRSG